MRLKPIALAFAAIVLILSFVMGDYDHADSRLGTFYTQMLAADFQGARKSLDEAIHLWPSNARYYSWRAYCISQMLPPQCPRNTQGLLSADAQKAAHEAIADYQRALELNTRDAVAHHNLAWLEHLVGDDTSAVADWRETTTLDPGNAVFHVSYGMFLEESGNAKEATEQYAAAIELSPAILDSPFFARYHSRFPEAADALVARITAKLEDRLRREGGDPILEARLGKLYLYQGELEQSAQLLEDAAKKLPNLPLVWLNLGDVRASQGDGVAAMGCYEKARVISRTLAGPYLRLGEVHLQRGEKSIAADELRVAVQKWQRVNPLTASHNNRLYQGPPQRIDDLLPTTLVWYVTPCEASRAWSALAVLFPGREEYARRSHTCEELPSPHATSKSE